MSDIKICRYCLSSSDNLSDVRYYPFSMYLEAFNNCKMQELVIPYACFMCSRMIQKFYNFKKQCTQAEMILDDILNTHGEITMESIMNHNTKLDLASNYVEKYLYLNTAIQIIINDPTKEEETDNGYQEDNYECNIPVKEEYDDSSVKMDDCNSSVKIEDSEVLNVCDGMSSDDDTPLSLHKSKDAKTVKKKMKVLKKSKRIKINGSSLLLDDIPKTKEVLKEKIDRRRREHRKLHANSRRTTNTGGVDMDLSNLEEYVNIINLTIKEQIEEVNARKDSSNYKNSVYKCSLCYKGFIDSEAWKHHLDKHDPNMGDAVCPICKFRFRTKRALAKHCNNHETKYKCKSCTYVSKTVAQAKQHQRWHKGVTYTCQYCDEILHKWTSYLSHVRIKHPSEFICSVCGYSFVSKLGLKMHHSMMHKDVEEKEESKDDIKDSSLFCKECDLQFTSEEAWKRHLLTSVRHTRSIKFGKGCLVCGEAFKDSEALRLHHRQQHARPRPANYGKRRTDRDWPQPCTLCAESIDSARDYWNHFRRMHPDKDYPVEKKCICDICGKGFKEKAFLVYHRRTHFEEKAFKCGQCPKEFHNRSNLVMHEKSHSEHRPYPCTQCCKAFKCKGALNRHFRSHTGERPYECGACGKRFAQSNTRKLHVRTVHLREPHPPRGAHRPEPRRAAAAWRDD